MLQSAHIVFIPENQQMPDAFTDVVNELPAGIKPRIVPWSGSVANGVQAVETILDREEIRQVILVGAGSGSAVAVHLARTQPRRVERLILDSPLLSVDPAQAKKLSSALKFMPNFLLRNKNKKELLAQLDEAQQQQPQTFSDIAAPTLIIAGSQQKASNFDELASQFPHAELRTIPGAGWLTFTTHGSATGTAMADFLKK